MSASECDPMVRSFLAARCRRKDRYGATIIIRRGFWYELAKAHGVTFEDTAVKS